MRIPAALTAIAAATLLLAPDATAQSPGAVLGTVKDSSGAPVEDIDVVLTPGPHVGRTNAAGAYEIRGLEPGRYLGRIRRLGYMPMTFTVDVGIGTLDTLNLQLNRYTASLAPVYVSEQAPTRRLASVIGREGRGLGRVIYAEDIAEKEYRSTRQVLQDSELKRALIGSQYVGGSCPARIYVDGRPYPRNLFRSPSQELSSGSNLNQHRAAEEALLAQLSTDVPLEEIEAVEAHSSLDFISTAADWDAYTLNMSQGRTNSRAGRACVRVVLIWTRRDVLR